MRLRRLYEDSEGVSPVIATILMVAIVVVLSAVIATFVLGLGSGVSDIAPQASFSFEWDDTEASTQDVLNVTHDGGDTITARSLYLRGDRGSGITTVSSGCDALGQSFDNYPIDSSGATMASDSEVTVTETVKLNCVAPDGEVDVIWNNNEGRDDGTSATLAGWDGPAA